MTKQVTKLAAMVVGATLLGACAGIREHRDEERITADSK